jgi:hypothetical protein
MLLVRPTPAGLEGGSGNGRGLPDSLRKKRVGIRLPPQSPGGGILPGPLDLCGGEEVRLSVNSFRFTFSMLLDSYEYTPNRYTWGQHSVKQREVTVKQLLLGLFSGAILVVVGGVTLHFLKLREPPEQVAPTESNWPAPQKLIQLIW